MNNFVRVQEREFQLYAKRGLGGRGTIYADRDLLTFAAYPLESSSPQAEIKAVQLWVYVNEILTDVLETKILSGAFTRADLSLVEQYLTSTRGYESPDAELVSVRLQLKIRAPIYGNPKASR